MFDGFTIARTLADLGTTDVVWLPDSTLGPWEAAFLAHPQLRLVRVCREGEAWAIAAGLYLGGREPAVVIQSTGLFESGDALRNVLHDMQLPLFAIIGYRSYLLTQSTDSAKRFVEPILRAWQLDYLLLDKSSGPEAIAAHRQACRAAGRPCIVLLPEGRG